MRVLDRQRYGTVLLLILADIALTSATSARGGLYALVVAIQGLAVLACLFAARLPPAQMRGATIAVAVAVVSVAASRIGASDDPGTFARLVNGTLIGIAPVVIARDLWSHPRVTSQTVAGALCIYLLIGLLFATLYGLTGRLGHGDLFRGVGDGTEPDRLYFSFITLTTTGYGDLVPGGGAARALAVMEALIGQIYLVTVIAVLVSRVGPRRRRGDA